MMFLVEFIQGIFMENFGDILGIFKGSEFEL